MYFLFTQVPDPGLLNMKINDLKKNIFKTRSKQRAVSIFVNFINDNYQVISKELEIKYET